MREYKYKAYNKLSTAIRNILRIDFNLGYVIVSNGRHSDRWEIEDIELMEYVGNFGINPNDLTITNEVYAGQIVECWVIDSEYVMRRGGLVDVEHNEVVQCGVVTWNEKLAMYTLGDKNNTPLHKFYTIEVIGNIYQDKHLLEG